MKKYEILKNLVEFNTIKDKENKELLDYIEKILLEKGFNTEFKDKILIISNDKKAQLGFLGHVDTVEYAEGWETSPFKLKIKNGFIYGLGTCDMKGGIAAIIDAILETDFYKLNHGIKLYLTYDEEIGFGGINDLINKNEEFPETIIFGEPTDNEVLIGSKGLFELELNFIGKKAHASNPNKGKSANINAINALFELNKFYEEHIKVEKDIKYEIPYTTMNIGIINGGTGKNSIPDNCFVTLDFRTIKSEHSTIILNKIKELSNNYNFDYKIIELVEPFYNEIDGIDSKRTSNFITEASLIKNRNRIILGLGPVTAHEINEHITEESYQRLVEQYKKIIIKYCK